MKNIRKRYAVIFFLGLFFGCSKNVSTTPEEPPLWLLPSFLSDGPWHLISSTTIDQSGVKSKYLGIPTDSVIFLYGDDGSQTFNSISMFTYINHVNSQCGYRVRLDTTIRCNPGWRDGYSDTLYCKAYSDSLLVFKVNKNSSIGGGSEIDSLKKIRFWHP